ncbi:UNVERIFIED_CONTAM: hypothetical protein K2H54_043149 [Gekko kuhli]
MSPPLLLPPPAPPPPPAVFSVSRKEVEPLRKISRARNMCHTLYGAGKGTESRTVQSGQGGRVCHVTAAALRLLDQHQVPRAEEGGLFAGSPRLRQDPFEASYQARASNKVFCWGGAVCKSGVSAVGSRGAASKPCPLYQEGRPPGFVPSEWAASSKHPQAATDLAAQGKTELAAVFGSGGKLAKER